LGGSALAADLPVKAPYYKASPAYYGWSGCYIGAMRNDPVGVADELALPDEALVIFGMTIGIPDPSIGTDVKPRLPQNVILHRERYSPPDPALLAAYDQRIRDFQAEQKMRHDQQKHHADMAGKVMGIAATAHAHDTKMEQMQNAPKPNGGK